jgi:hypothetical protein
VRHRPLKAVVAIVAEKLEHIEIVGFLANRNHRPPADTLSSQHTAFVEVTTSEL